MCALSISKAIDTILSSVSILDVVDTELSESLGLVLAESVIASDDVPFTDNSAMDGFAVKSSDLETASSFSIVKLKLEDEMITAGMNPLELLPAGKTRRIMTGAVIPEGCDAVVQVENAKVEGDYVLFEEKIESGKNIRRAGEDIKAGSVVLPRGTVMTPAAIGAAASAGAALLRTYKRPVIAVLTTGDEIIHYSEKISPGKVRNSNSIVLQNLVRMNNAVPVDLGTAVDDKLDIAERIDTSRNADAVLISGGVSMGERDLIRLVLEELGFKMKFWKVHIKPGRPLLFGILDNKPVFGLPGNPVSTQVAFEIFVRPAILKMMGHQKIFRKTKNVILKTGIKHTPGRPEFIRMKLEELENRIFAEPTRIEQGSGITTSMLNSDGLLFVDENTVFIPEGESAPCLILAHHDSSEFPLLLESRNND